MNRLNRRAGRGVRLFDGALPERLGLRIVEVVNSPEVTHINYQIVK